MIGYGVRRGKLYYLDLVSDSSKKLAEALIVADSQEEKNQETIWLWHRHLGHASFSYLKKLFPALFSDIGASKLRCNVCELTKSHRASFDSSLNKRFFPFQIIHSDVWGPSTPSSLGGSRWFVIFINDCTRMIWICHMKSKGKVNALFQKFHKTITTQYNMQI